MELATLKNVDITNHQELTNAIVSSFHQSNRLNEEATSILILETLIKRFQPTFNLDSYLTKIVPSAIDRKALLIALIHGIYYHDIDISKFSDPENYLLQIAAENISHNTLLEILKRLSQIQTLSLIAHVYMNYREGSFYILNSLSQLYSDNPEMTQLLSNLNTKYYDANKLGTLNHQHPLSTILQELDHHSLNQVVEIKAILDEIIPKIIHLPVAITVTLEKIRELHDKNNYQPDLANIRMAETFAEIKSQELQKHFSFFSRNWTIEKYNQLFQIMGLSDHVSNWTELPLGSNYLLERLKLINSIFSNITKILSISPPDILHFTQFVHALCLNLHWMHQPPAILEQLKNLSAVIPTANKDLEQTCGLISLVQSFRTLFDFLNKNSLEKLSLNDFPLIVFDQSSPELFAKNSQYIKQLMNQYACNITHVSRTRILTFAKKLQIEPLIDTSHKGYLGYGGMRNTVFLLTPMIKQLQEMSGDALRADFQQDVIGSAQNLGAKIFMIDDDMWIPQFNILHYLYVEAAKPHSRLNIRGSCIGRATKNSVRYLSLKEVLDNPAESYKSFHWSFDEFNAVMSEHFSHPKLCLNIPSAGEELLFLEKTESVLLGQRSIHLAGNHLPKDQWPTHPIVGLEQHLKNYIPYTLQVSLMTLLDTSDNPNRDIFPWNRELHPIHDLHEMIQKMSDSHAQKEIQQKFWENIKILINPNDDTPYHFKADLLKLIHEDVEQVSKIFNSKTFQEEKSLQALIAIYKFNQQDAKYLLELAAMIYPHHKSQQLAQEIDTVKTQLESKYQIQLSDYTTCYHFYLLLKSVGASEFFKQLKLIL